MLGSSNPEMTRVAGAQMLGQIKTEEDEAAWDKKVAALNEELLLWDAHLSEGYSAGKEFTLAGARASGVMISPLESERLLQAPLHVTLSTVA